MKKFQFSILKKAKTNAGLDIGSCNIKVVELEEKNGSFVLVNAAIKETGPQNNTLQEITSLFKQAGIRAKKVNIAVSGENTVARYLSLPKMSEAELKKAMEFQLEDHIPFKPEEVYVDYQTLGEDEGASNKLRLFLVASKKELIDSRIKLIKQAGLEPQVITTDALALKNTFYFNYPAKTESNITLLNAGSKFTNILISKRQIPYFLRDAKFGGETITNSIQTALQIERNNAESLKQNPGSSPAEVPEIIKSAMSSLLNEIFVSLDFYENLTEQRIDEVYVSGGSSQLTGLKEFLAGYLNIPILPLDPFKNFSVSSRPKEAFLKLAPFMAVAVGLALEKP